MDVAQALRELRELSSQVDEAVVLDADSVVLGSTIDDPAAVEGLAEAARGLLAAAAELRSSAEADEVTSAEIELSEGAFFVLREGGLTIAATTGPRPTAGLVTYDLRTCLRSLGESERTKRPRSRTAADEAANT